MRGVGEMGRVAVSQRIWDKCVLANLLKNYQQWDRKQTGIRPSNGQGILAIFQAPWEAAGGGGGVIHFTKTNKHCQSDS